MDLSLLLDEVIERLVHRDYAGAQQLVDQHLSDPSLGKQEREMLASINRRIDKERAILAKAEAYLHSLADPGADPGDHARRDSCRPSDEALGGRWTLVSDNTRVPVTVVGRAEPTVDPRTPDTPAQQVDERALEEALADLERLVGMSEVKRQVRSLANYLRLQRRRAAHGLATPKLSNHLALYGSPGTGKTTIARLLGRIYHALGILRTDRVTEVSRADLVGRYVGETAQKTNQIIDQALDGVLFVDEAYALHSHSDNDFGQEAVAELIKRMEDQRERLVVILAGYPQEMRAFIDSNPGLRSRISHHIHFPDYTPQELGQIFTLMAQQYDYVLSDSARRRLDEIMQQAVASEDGRLGNGRFARNLLESALLHQADRLAQGGFTSDAAAWSRLEDEDLRFDLPQARKQPVGFH